MLIQHNNIDISNNIILERFLKVPTTMDHNNAVILYVQSEKHE